MNETNQLEQDSKHSHRRSYLLRLWRANSSGGPSWRASLEDPHTNERIGFASLEQLFVYLMGLLERDDRRSSEPAKEQS